MRVMNVLIVTFVAIFMAFTGFKSVSQGSNIKVYSQVEDNIAFIKFLGKSEKTYDTPAEVNYRFKVFAENIKNVKELNDQYNHRYLSKYKKTPIERAFEIGGTGDLSKEELEARYILRYNLGIEAITKDRGDVAGYRYASYGREGYELRVRDHGSCNACWAFATVASLEKQYFEDTGKQVDLSPQNLVDCVLENFGCNGGHVSAAMFYASTHGLMTSSHYPYMATRRYCQYDPSKAVRMTISPDNSFDFNVDEASKMTKRGIHPASAVKADGSFRFLSSSEEVFDASLTDDCNYAVNHAINIIDARDGYVTVLNNWGDAWGHRGIKNIRPCSDDVLFGLGARLIHG